MNRLKSSIHASSEEVSKSVEAITEEVVNFEKGLLENSNPKDLEISDKIYHIVKDELRGFEVNVSNLIVLVTKVVEICDKFRALDGNSRKENAISVINKFIKEDLEIEDAIELSYIEMTVENLIETVIQSSKGDLKLNLKAKKKNQQLSNTPPSQIIESLIDKLKTIVRNNQYNPDTLIINIPVIVGMLMGIIEEYPNLNGVQKKNIIMQIMKRLIKEIVPKLMEVDEEQLKKLDISLNTVADTIDLLVLVGKNNIDINPEKVKNFISKLFCCCCRK